MGGAFRGIKARLLCAYHRRCGGRVAVAITLGNLVNAPRQCTGRSRLVRNPAYTPCKSISQWAQHHHLYSPNKPRIRLGAPGILRRTSSARRPERQTSRSSPPAPPSLALFASGGTHRRLATLCAEPGLVVVAHPFVSCASISSAHRRRARPAVISPGRACARRRRPTFLPSSLRAMCDQENRRT